MTSDFYELKSISILIKNRNRKKIVSKIRNIIDIWKNIFRTMTIDNNYKTNSTSSNSKNEVFIFQPDILRFLKLLIGNKPIPVKAYMY